MRCFSAVRHSALELPRHAHFEAVPLPPNSPISVAWYKDGYFKIYPLPDECPDKVLSGDPLIVQLLIGKAIINGDSYQTMCNKLRITFGLYLQLKNGIRDMKDISMELVEAISAYLDVPTEVVIAKVKLG